MPAILKVGTSQFFFTSTTQAAKALEMLSKATPVERNYNLSSGETTAYQEIDPLDGHSYRTELELKITQQRKPRAPQLRLPGE